MTWMAWKNIAGWTEPDRYGVGKYVDVKFACFAILMINAEIGYEYDCGGWWGRRAEGFDEAYMHIYKYTNLLNN